MRTIVLAIVKQMCISKALTETYLQCCVATDGEFAHDSVSERQARQRDFAQRRATCFDKATKALFVGTYILWIVLGYNQSINQPTNQSIDQLQELVSSL
jgi:hypothetical protein